MIVYSGGHTNDFPVYGIAPGQIGLVETPADEFVEVPGMGLMHRDLAEEYAEWIADLDPESKALRAWEWE